MSRSIAGLLIASILFQVCALLMSHQVADKGWLLPAVIYASMFVLAVFISWIFDPTRKDTDDTPTHRLIMEGYRTIALVMALEGVTYEYYKAESFLITTLIVLVVTISLYILFCMYESVYYHLAVTQPRPSKQKRKVLT